MIEEKTSFEEYIEGFRVGRLTKLSDDKYEGKHPNGVYEGHTSKGFIVVEPEVESFCWCGSLRTSMITEILEESEKLIVFKTLNSTYKLEIEDE